MKVINFQFNTGEIVGDIAEVGRKPEAQLTIRKLIPFMLFKSKGKQSRIIKVRLKSVRIENVCKVKFYQSSGE